MPSVRLSRTRIDGVPQAKHPGRVKKYRLSKKTDGIRDDVMGLREKEKRGRNLPLFGFASGYLNLLCNLCSLTNAATQVVQLCTANLTIADNLELCNVRGVYREGLLNANAVRNAANGDGLVDAGVLHRNDDALEYLNTLAVALLDLCVNLYGVADLELGQIALELLLRQNLY